MSDCIFCKIVSGEMSSYKMYEDDDFIAFLDVFPLAKGHTLVVPKKHIEWVWDYPELGKYFEVVGRVARGLREKLNVRLVRSSVVGTDVPHAHVHLFPGKKNNLKGEKLSEEEAKRFVAKFRVFQ